MMFYLVNEHSLKNIIINLLALKSPQNTNDLHKLIKKDFKLNLSYQAIHKTIKQLVKEKCLLEHQKNYSINPEWIKEVSNFVKKIEAGVQGKKFITQTTINKSKSKLDVIIAREGILRDKLRDQELHLLIKEFIPILKEEHKVHNIFHKPVEEVLTYLLNIQKEHELFIALIDDKVVGGCVLEKKDESMDEKHKVWKLKHLALKKELTFAQEKEILSEIEDRLKHKSPSMKIQLNLSEKEKRYIDIFKKHGYKKEGTLENHYRVGENMYIYSKLFRNSK